METTDMNSGSYIDLAGSHQQAIEWLSLLDFYSYELNFLSKLLQSSFPRYATASQLAMITSQETRLKIASRRLRTIRQAVLRYEHYLTGLDESSVWLSAREIRRRDAQCSERMKFFESEMINLKKDMFSFIETESRLTKRDARRQVTTRIERAFEDGTLAL